MNIQEILTQAVRRDCSDVLLIPGLPVSMKAQGVISREDTPRLSPAETRFLATEVYALAANRSLQKMDETGDDDFSFSLPGLARFRVNVFKQRGSVAMVIRVVPFVLPDRMSLGIPDNVMAFSKLARGLVLVTGPAGSGKSTTLACLIHEMNETRNGHIITLEDPIEFLYHHHHSIVTQRDLHGYHKLRSRFKKRPAASS